MGERGAEFGPQTKFLLGTCLRGCVEGAEAFLVKSLFLLGQSFEKSECGLVFGLGEVLLEGSRKRDDFLPAFEVAPALRKGDGGCFEKRIFGEACQSVFQDQGCLVRAL